MHFATSTNRTAATGLPSSAADLSDEALLGGLHRRSILAAGIAGLGAAMAGGGASAADKPYFKRTDLPIGIQLYTLGADAQTDLDGALAALAKIGFKTVELPGFMGRTPVELKAAFDRAGLTCPSVHVPGRPMGPGLTLSGDLAQLADSLHAVGATSAVMPLFYIPDRFELRPAAGEDGAGFLRRLMGQMTADDWKWNADFLNTKGEVLKKAGIKLGYHNHNGEFAPVGGSNGMEILLAQTDPGLITFEMDAGWVVAAGQDPAALLKKHKGRFTLMHVKDVKPTTKPNVTLQMDPAEVGSGMIDWSKLLPAAYAAGVRGFFVEQEPPFTRPRLEAAKISFDYLAGVTG